MTNRKFAAGAFVFTRPRGLQPRDPQTVEPVAQRHGFDPSIIPEYAGDRAAIGRAIQTTSSGLYREGFLLRPIKRTSAEVTYGIVRERKDEFTEKLDHEHQATVSWKAEPDSSIVEGDHPIARRINSTYQNLRCKIVAEDWSGAITTYLESHDAARVRDDGRIYWVPPQRVDDVKRFGNLLSEVGIDLILCEMEPEVKTVVQDVVHTSFEDQLEKLQAEVEQFDGTQKPSTYARRLDEYQKLRERAILYHDALGVGIEQTENILSELEQKVSTMLDLRRKTVIHRDGTAEKTSNNETIPETTKIPETPPETKQETPTVCFAGTELQPAEPDEPGTLLFISSDEPAKRPVKALESMGLAGKWQQAGPVKVSIQNSGPPGAETSIRIQLPSDVELSSAKKSLAALGVELAS